MIYNIDGENLNEELIQDVLNGVFGRDDIKVQSVSLSTLNANGVFDATENYMKNISKNFSTIIKRNSAVLEIIKNTFLQGYMLGVEHTKNK